MRRAALVTSIAVLCAGAAFAGEAQPEVGAPAALPAAFSPSQLLGIVDATLVRVDPASLQPLRRPRLAIGSGGCASSQGGTACWASPPWSFSPARTRIAIARNDSSALQIVNASSLRALQRLPWGADGGRMAALAWLTRTRVVGIQEVNGERQRLVVFDLAKGKVAATQPLNGRVAQLARTARKLVLLVTPAKAIGVARVTVVGSRGVVSSTGVARIAAGAKLLGTGSAHAVDSRSPGLALDPLTMRAFVAGPDLVAAVDLRAGAVSYHSLEQPRSLAARLWNWLEPAAHAKQVSGYLRQARWLGGDVLAVSGSDTAEGRYRATGLRLVDTASWRVRTLDREASGFRVSGDALAATGGWWDDAANRSRGIGLTVYSSDGTKRFQILDGLLVWIAAVYDGRAYVGVAGESGPLRIVDVTTGQVVGTRSQDVPELLVGSDSWSEG